MSTIRSIRRLAAEILGVGESRVWVSPEDLDRVSAAITREDVKRLIRDGLIKARAKDGVSRGRARVVHRQRRKGLRKGPGSRGGLIMSKRDLWIRRIRSLRGYLAYLRGRRIITSSTYRRLYLMAKGGVFESRAQIDSYVRKHGLAKR